MDWALLVDLVGKIIWPIVVLVLGWRLLPRIDGLLARIKKLSAGGIETELDVPPLPPAPETKALPAGSNATSPEPAPAADAAPAAEPDLVQFAPDGAVINAWSRLQSTMQQAALRLGASPTQGRRPENAVDLARAMQSADVLDAAALAVCDQLRRIRNDVVHGGARPTESSARAFSDTVDELVKRIDDRTDELQLGSLMRILQVTSPVEIRVSPHNTVAVAPTFAEAWRIADTRRGQWVAAAKNVKVPILERDAALLVSRGARQVQDVDKAS